LLRIRGEEVPMETEFGGEWRADRRRKRRLIPFAD
jgi:protein-S-isoprenylcysteine O-methyltransferase Ste14